MPESLFAPRRFRRSYLAYCALTAISLEGSVIGIAQIWPQNKTVPTETIITEIDLGPTDPVQELILPMEDPQPTPDEPTPPPEETPEPEDTPPPDEEPEMTLDTPKPTPSVTPTKKARFVMPPGTPDPRAKRGPNPQNGVVGGVPSAARTAGPLPTKKPSGRIVVSQPPYPAQAKAARLKGSGTFRVTTDASGHAVSVSTAQSTGSGILDDAAVKWGKMNWSGPPSTTFTVPMTFRLQ